MPLDTAAYTDSTRLAQLLAVCKEIGTSLTAHLTVSDVLETISYKIADTFNPGNWSLLLVDEQRQDLHFALVVGDFPAAERLKSIRLQIGEGIAGRVAATGEPLVVPNVAASTDFSPRVDEAVGFATESIVCIPLKARDRVLGVIELVNTPQMIPPQELDMEILTTVADYAAIALDNARQYEEVQRLTITDDLSGLYNARHLHAMLGQQIACSHTDGQPFGVVFFDLDNFKRINDNYGHLVGSWLLGQIGHFTAEHLPDRALAARYGGDEFVILLPGCDQPAVLAWCQSFRELLRSHAFTHEPHPPIRLTASFGIACYPDDGLGRDDLLHAADCRMYVVKDSGKDDIRAVS